MAGCICGEFKVSSLVDNGVEKETGVACVVVNGVVGWVSGVCVRLLRCLRWCLRCFEGEFRPRRLRCLFFLWARGCFDA